MKRDLSARTIGGAAKKFFTFSLSTILVASMLTGCGNGEVNQNAVAGDTASALETTAVTTLGNVYLPTAAEDSSIYVAPISGIDESFIRGMDISSLLVEEASGVKYYDENGQEQDLFKILADNGVNWIRVRVWNNPYDADGNGYGGGNCDATTAATLGYRAAQYGMKLNVDFHYSDFWADPNKQMAPKAWENMSISEKETAIYDYTVESLKAILDAGADVSMVQIGNEINNGLAGETDKDNIIALLKQASAAVRAVSAEYNKDIKIAVHYTGIDTAGAMTKVALWLNEEELDYDIFGVSYYPYWHGTLHNLKLVLTAIKGTYNKDVCVLETSFPYTGEDGDGFGNSISADDITGDYICSAQSQADSVWDIMNVMGQIGGLGVFYWEGAWIPVGSEYESNTDIWNQQGCGWASVYSIDYDPKDAGKYYGGCSWDNQAFFDFNGNVLPSIGVFKYIYYGTNTDLELQFLEELSVDCTQGEEVVMPEGVNGVYNDRSKNGLVPVTWSDEDIANVDITTGGEYKVSGVTEDGTEILATVNVKYANLLTDSSFDEGGNDWRVTYESSTNPTDIQTKAADAHSGEKAFHFWLSDEEVIFDVEQDVIAEADGLYNAFAYMQGGDGGSDYEISLYIKVNGEIVVSDDSSQMRGWKVWQNPAVNGAEAKAGDTITVGMHVKCAAGGWGTIDDFCLYKN